MYFLWVDIWLLPLIVSVLMGNYAYRSLRIAFRRTGAQQKESSTEVSKRAYRAFEFFFTITVAIVGGIIYLVIQVDQNAMLANLAKATMNVLALLQYFSCCFLIIAVTAHLGSKYERWVVVLWKEWWRWLEPWMMIFAYIVSTIIWVFVRCWSSNENGETLITLPAIAFRESYNIELTQVLIISLTFIGVIMGIWRYELSKYNEIARKELDKLSKIFHSEILGKEKKIDLKCTLMTMATFNSTHAWLETKRIFNRLLGLSSVLEFRPKTPRYFEELTEVTKAINNDNGIKSIPRFFPVIKSDFQDQNYKEWLDLIIELLSISTTGEFYQIDKCFKFLRRYIKYGLSQSGNMCTFEKYRADNKFSDFLKRQRIIQLSDHMKGIFSFQVFCIRNDIDNDTKKLLSDYLKMKFLEEEKYLRNKGFSSTRTREIMEEIRDHWEIP